MGEKQVELKNTFTWHEKLFMRAGVAALAGIGTLAIYRSTPAAAIGYLLFVGISGLVVIYDSLCVYCPYPFKHSDCLFLPHQLITSLTTMRATPIPRYKNVLSALAFGGIVLIPQYWLWGQWGLCAAFWTLTVTGGIAVPFHFCRRCRHQRCPMNLVTPETEAQR